MTSSNPTRGASTAHQRGVSMVEALVALVVLSVGMLGIASLYVASLQAGRTALIRTQAVSLVNDMIDRIRANPVARDGYDLAKYGGAPNSNSCVANADNCSTTKLAEDDLYTWLLATKEALPGKPTANVTVTPAASAGLPDTYLVRVQWVEAGDPNPLSYQGNLSLIPVKP